MSQSAPIAAPMRKVRWPFWMRKPRWLAAILASIAVLTVAMGALLYPPSRQSVCDGLMKDPLVQGPETAQRLAIVLHGMRMEPGDLKSLTATILSTPGYADTRLIVPRLPVGIFSTAQTDDISACLITLVDREWQKREAAGQPYRSMLLVGHSIGSLFVRKLYVVARGELKAAPFEKGLREALGMHGDNAGPVPRRGRWVDTVDRIVLLGAINRGWSADHHMPLVRMVQIQTGLAFSRLVQAMNGPALTVMATRKGAPFVTQLRLQWLAMMDCSSPRLARESSGPQPTSTGRCDEQPQTAVADVVQLLGTQDDLIPPGDGIDPVTGGSFTYLEVPHSDHRNVVVMDSNTPEGEARSKVLLKALGPAPVKSDATPELVSARGQPDFDVKHVVFVMHGIRDEGFWTERLASRVRARLRKLPDCGDVLKCKIRIDVSSYGYFPMLSFLKPGARNEKVEWLMDRYAQARAQYPDAKFHYVGHSHGTYLLKKALDNYEAVRFERVALAGSVLRTDEDWPALLESKRVKGILNLSASGDWVVAFFPNALQQLGLQDLGGAGFYGFDEYKVQNFEQFPSDGKSWVVGGHGAAVAEDWWDPVAGFIATGQRPEPKPAMLQDEQSGPVKAGGFLALGIWALIAAALALVAWLIWQARVGEGVKTAALIAYGWFIWFVLTSV
jgi:hypothetical protein